MNNKITGIIISYNEEKNIHESIKSLIDIVDELIVIDTGSTDQTVPILKLFGNLITYYQKDWGNNFSEIRNYGISKASNEICFMLDADEIVTEISKVNFKEIIRSNFSTDPNALYAPYIKNINSIDTTNNARLFKKRDTLKYKGRVHEYLYEENSTVLALHSIILEHKGYMPEIYNSKNKFERNKKLLELQIIEEPDNIRWNYFILRYLNYQSVQYKDILYKYSLYEIPYSKEYEIYLLNINILFIIFLMSESDYERAFFHAEKLHNYYKDQKCTFLYLLCLFSKERKRFKNKLNEINLKLNDIINLPLDPYIDITFENKGVDSIINQLDECILFFKNN